MKPPSAVLYGGRNLKKKIIIMNSKRITHTQFKKIPKQEFQRSCKHWTPKQHNKTAQPKADKYFASQVSPFNCCLVVVSSLKKGIHWRCVCSQRAPWSLPPMCSWLLLLSVILSATSMIFVATNTCLSRQNTSFVSTKYALATNTCLSRQT